MTCTTIGIDFGESRIGVALSDSEGRVAMPLTTIRRTSDGAAIEELLRLVEEHEVESIVVGEPRQQSGARSPSARRARSFGRKLRRATELEVRFVDESLSTVEATERLREAGLSGRRLRDHVDSVAAQVLLQEALDDHVADVPKGSP